MKKLLPSALLLSALALSGCSGAGTPESDPTPAPSPQSVDEQPQEEAPVPPELTGDWVFTSPENAEDAMRATIADGVVSVDWDLQNAGLVGIYWVGTFEAPTTADEPYTWTSQRDAAATDSALFAANVDSKDFPYQDGVLSFDVTIQGETATVEMKRP